MEQGGKHATLALRVTQFLRVIEVRGAAMWCTFRQVPVGFQEKCTAANHVKSSKPLDIAAKKPTVMDAPGASGQVAPKPSSPPSAEKQKTVDMRTVL